MKKKNNTHPKYQEVLFVDSSTGYRFVCGSTLQPEAKEMFQGKEYPVYYVPISSSSHPFFTGSKQVVDSEGRVDRFKKRYASKVVAPAAESAEVAAPSATASAVAAKGKKVVEKEAKKPAARKAK